MADVIDGTLGFGTVTGTSAAPDTLLTFTAALRLNFISLVNDDTTNWLFAKASDDPGCYQIAKPGETLTIARGPQASNNLFGVIGFGAEPLNADTAAVVVHVKDKKMA